MRESERERERERERKKERKMSEDDMRIGNGNVEGESLYKFLITNFPNKNEARNKNETKLIFNIF